MALRKKTSIKCWQGCKGWEGKNSCGTINQSRYYGNQYGSSSKKLKSEHLYDPAIPLLEIYPNIQDQLNKCLYICVYGGTIHNSSTMQCT
jgi:hypothetical protein